MPRYWHDKHAVNKLEDEEQRNFCRRIVADKKPYFMRYIYPDLARKYNTYIKNTDKKALREYQMTVAELQSLPADKLSDEQSDFLRYYEYRMPVGRNDCVMNKICRMFEANFDGYIARNGGDEPFDYQIMKSGQEYTPRQFDAIKQLYNEYNKRLRIYSVFTDYEKIDKIESSSTIALMNQEFIKECAGICPNKKVLCDIVLDICYTRSGTKRFAWSMCGEEIIDNLLRKNNNTIAYPTLDENGTLEYCGNRFTVEYQKIEVDE